MTANSAPRLATEWRRMLLLLKRGWDGTNNSLPITNQALDTVGNFAVVPRTDGGVQLEIHQDGFDIEIEIDRGGHIFAVESKHTKGTSSSSRSRPWPEGALTEVGSIKRCSAKSPTKDLLCELPVGHSTQHQVKLGARNFHHWSD